jgi:hypothetical protein
MTRQAAIAFDDGARQLVQQIYPNAEVELRATSTITWGFPH